MNPKQIYGVFVNDRHTSIQVVAYEDADRVVGEILAVINTS